MVAPEKLDASENHAKYNASEHTLPRQLPPVEGQGFSPATQAGLPGRRLVEPGRSDRREAPFFALPLSQHVLEFCSVSAYIPHATLIIKTFPPQPL